ncbi:integrase [Arthrobacter silviterrae]|uniref:Site-specific integrase n=1 Tax=Arthrobacter silviterrae TaxID=2026658 RepID=A0ABX0D538_9MICC|nr:site-specific integrase [Arthrobacter silviterrae]MDQ0279516.1 integrase [Arthrobacter silviterrae]NGN82004.1 site-specific integrase [Arthrobacter silviterrae]
MKQNEKLGGSRIDGLVVIRAGTVSATDDATLPWAVLTETGLRVAPVEEFLRDLLACGNSAASCRSYAYDLLRWSRFLAAVEVPWHRATSLEVRDFVLWLKTAHNPARDRHRENSAAAGSVNRRTGKAALSAGYAPATINHAISVIACFYDFHLETGQGPVISPVPGPTRAGGHIGAHHNPLEPFAAHSRGRYRQKEPEREPRAVPDDVVEDLFSSLSCHRDRALFSMFLSSGARAAELLAMTVDDVRPGQGRIYVRSKGLGGVKEPCPASPEAFAWLTLYLGEMAQVEGLRPGPGEPLWWTRRHPLRPLTYTALRAILNRINEKIGATVSVHDLRHTLAIRLVEDPGLSLVDVQHVMRHRWITTTTGYLRPRPDEVIAKVAEHYGRPRHVAGARTGWAYDPDDLADLFGNNK